VSSRRSGAAAAPELAGSGTIEGAPGDHRRVSRDSSRRAGRAGRRGGQPCHRHRRWHLVITCADSDRHYRRQPGRRLACRGRGRASARLIGLARRSGTRIPSSGRPRRCIRGRVSAARRRGRAGPQTPRCEERRAIPAGAGATSAHGSFASGLSGLRTSSPKRSCRFRIASWSRKR
jgi:hypothetical protein